MISYVYNSHPNNPIIISSDFYNSNISWLDSQEIHNEKLAPEFIKCVLDNALTQFVNLPTRKNNLLDLMFCKNLTSLPDIEYASLLIDSDHEFVKVISDFPNSPSTGYELSECAINFKLSFKKADYVQLQNYLSSVNWFLTFSFINSIQQMWEYFERILWEGIRQFVPLVKSKTNFKISPKFINKLLLKKRKAWYLLKVTKSTNAKIKFKGISNVFVHLKLNYIRINKSIQSVNHIILSLSISLFIQN